MQSHILVWYTPVEKAAVNYPLSNSINLYSCTIFTHVYAIFGICFSTNWYLLSILPVSRCLDYIYQNVFSTLWRWRSIYVSIFRIPGASTARKLCFQNSIKLAIGLPQILTRSLATLAKKKLYKTFLFDTKLTSSDNPPKSTPAGGLHLLTTSRARHSASKGSLNRPKKSGN